MMRRMSWILEGGLFLLAVGMLYVLAMGVLPLFREPHGLFVQVFEDGDFTAAPPLWVFASSALFCLAGALMAHWVPVLSLRTLATFWGATYVVYWGDAAFALTHYPEGWKTPSALLLGLIALLLSFALFPHDSPEGSTHFLHPTWRSRLAGGWLIVWMGFFAGTSAVLLSEVPLYPLPRLVLSLATLAMSLWSYRLSALLQRAQGEEDAGATSTWRWLLTAWALLALLHYLLRVRGEG